MIYSLNFKILIFLYLLFIINVSFSNLLETTTSITDNSLFFSLNNEDEINKEDSGGKFDTSRCLLDPPDLSQEENGDRRYIPSDCQFLYNDVSTKISPSKTSCCLKSQDQLFHQRKENIISQLHAPLYTCGTKDRLSKTGFSLKEFLAANNGSTPDLTTNDGTSRGDSLLENILDTRYYVKVCAEHLAALQCMRCSSDQRSVLGRDGTNYRPKDYSPKQMPLFYLRDRNGDGQPFVLCEQYKYQLFNYCQFVDARSQPFTELYALNGMLSNDFLGITDNPGIPNGILLDPYFSVDFLDVFFTSNVNCYTRELPAFTEPKCTNIVNNLWSSRYIDSPNPLIPTGKSYFSSTTKLSTPRTTTIILIPIIVFFLFSII